MLLAVQAPVPEAVFAVVFATVWIGAVTLTLNVLLLACDPLSNLVCAVATHLTRESAAGWANHLLSKLGDGGVLLVPARGACASVLFARKSVVPDLPHARLAAGVNFVSGVG